jgi:hypothetical protein
MEILIGEGEDKSTAEKKIRDLADELDLQIMTEVELKEFTDKLEAGWNRGEYTKETFDVEF